MSSFETVLDQFCSKRVLVVGDIMLDRFVYGTVSRISPEAPAPVIRTAGPVETIGGSGNVARNVAALGAACEIISVVGGDEAASTIRSLLKSCSIETDGLVDDGARVTTLKMRFIANLHNTHLLRADTEDTRPVIAKVEDEIIEKARRRIEGVDRIGVDAVIFSDYAKGVLTQKVTAEVIAIARRAGKPVIVDPKGNDYSRYRGATAIAPNVAELAELSGRPITNDQTVIAEAANDLIAAVGCDCVLVTRGERGMLIATREGEQDMFPATAKRVIDVSGAGDTVAAAFTLGLVAGAGFVRAAQLANAAAGVVVSKKGTSQVTARELREVLLSRPHFELQEKIHRFDTIGACVEAWRKDGLTVGFTNGCFDLLHPGHVRLLCEARSHCDRLVVGINDDASVKRLKGAGRPIQSETARAIVLAGLAFVDAVILFAEDTPLALIGAIVPDVLVKGADYSMDRVVGRDLVESGGGKVVLVDLMPDTSTTRIVNKVKTGGPDAVAQIVAAK
jgi:D-beta-D-heptose 7-phosphate kinase / D-beta-D-heptose 1-phosphate adenosyltransferase